MCVLSLLCLLHVLWIQQMLLTGRQWGETLVYRARLPAAAAAAAGVNLADSSVFVQDVGRFFFAYPITIDSEGDVVWTVGVTGEEADAAPPTADAVTNNNSSSRFKVLTQSQHYAGSTCQWPRSG